jgi:Tfp pilus assembly protein PilN
MVQDNINLFERKAPSGLASPQVRWAIFGCATVVALGVVALGVQSRGLLSQRQELARVQARTNRLQHAMTEVPSPDVALAERLAAKERDVQALEAVARTLSTGGLAHTAGFVAPLQAFGRASTEGVWLTGLTLDNRHGSMVLEGRALDASRIPALLQTLKAEPYFAGTTFSAIEVTPGTDGSPIAADRVLKFRISTPVADAETHEPLAQADAVPAPTDRNQR